MGFGCGRGQLRDLLEPGACSALAAPLPSQIAGIICAVGGAAPADWEDTDSVNSFTGAEGRYLPVKGEMPKAEPNRATLGHATNGSLITTHRKYSAALQPVAICEEYRQFIALLGNNWRGFRFWLVTDGGRMIGGAAGIKPAWVDAGAYYPQGRDSLEELYLDLEWYGAESPLAAYVPGIGAADGGGTDPGPATQTQTLVQSYPDHQTNALVWTANNGVLPTPTNSKVWVFQNGKRLNPFTNEYTIQANSGPAQSTVLVNSNTHFDGSDYLISVFL